MPRASRPRKVLLLNHNRRGEGTFFRCWHLARHLGRQGIEVNLFTVSPEGRFLPRVEFRNGVTIYETPNFLDELPRLGYGYGVPGIPYRILAALRGSCDLVHAFDHKPSVLLPTLVARAMRDLPFVADWSDWWGWAGDGSGLQEVRSPRVTRWETRLEEFTHRSADWVTTISSGLKDRAWSLDIPQDRITWIPSGAPSDLIRPRARDACRRHLGLPASLFLLGHVGKRVRDMDVLVPALDKLADSYPQIRLGIVGPEPADQESVPEGHSVRFGRVPFNQLGLYLGACDAFLLPMRDTVYQRTRWPNKFGDYLAAGRPVLCSDVGDVAQIVRSQGCGIVWESSSDLVAAVESLLTDGAAAGRMGERARELAETDLSWSRLAENFVAVYQELF